MLESLQQRFGSLMKTLRGHARLSEDNIADAMREVRQALLEADVALPVVKRFVDEVRQEAHGQEVLESLTPGQAVIAVVHRALIRLMGEQHAALTLRGMPAVVLMVGLQGVGKTTTSAKLARLLAQQKKKVMLVSTDVYRPAAIEQLRTLTTQLQGQFPGITFFPSDLQQDPLAIARAAQAQAKRQLCDVLIVDTAGRLSVDEAMMDEIRQLHRVLDPSEVLFVVDAMQGQDAVNTAQAFGSALPLGGVVLTKLDGDARGGAALSVRAITGKPIKYMGTSEKLGGLEAFHPERMASRILGMGDVLSLIEEVRDKVDHAEAERFAKKLQFGKGFDLVDFRAQLAQMRKMTAEGGIGGMLEKLPGIGAMQQKLSAAAQGPEAERKLRRTQGVLDAMTLEERRKPDLLKASRKQRIARGAGVSVQEVNQTLKQFEDMQKMMKVFSGKNPFKMMQALRSMGGGGMGMR